MTSPSAQKRAEQIVREWEKRIPLTLGQSYVRSLVDAITVAVAQAVKDNNARWASLFGTKSAIFGDPVRVEELIAQAVQAAYEDAAQFVEGHADHLQHGNVIYRPSYEQLAAALRCSPMSGQGDRTPGGRHD